MNETDKWQLIASYVSGNYTEEQEQKVLCLQMQDAAFAKDLDKAMSDFDTDEQMSIRFDKDKGRAILFAHIKRRQQYADYKSGKWTTGSRTGNTMKWIVAASLFTLIAGAWLYNKPAEKPAEFVSVIVAKGNEHSTVTMEDGTVVYLNGKTTLRYPKSFGTKDRTVFLDGDAFFIVHKDAARPFFVRSGTINTQVLGTSFRIRSTSINNRVEVMVANGKVAVKKENTLLSYLTPGQGLDYDGVTNTTKKHTYKPAEINAINDQVLYFNNTLFSDVATELEKWYGVKVILRQKHIRESRLSGEFKNVSLHNVLQSIAISSGISFKQDHDTVYLNEINH